MTNTTIEIDGKPVDPNDPLAEQAANAAPGTIGNFQRHADEAAREAQHPPILIVIFHNKSTTHLRTRGFTSTYTYKMKSIEKRIYI